MSCRLRRDDSAGGRQKLAKFVDVFSDRRAFTPGDGKNTRSRVATRHASPGPVCQLSPAELKSLHRFEVCVVRPSRFHRRADTASS